MFKSTNNLILDAFVGDSKVNSIKLLNNEIIFSLHVKSCVFIKEISDKYCIVAYVK
jgi:hypothetical protein